MIKSHEEGKDLVSGSHTGDPCIYGAIREQMDILDDKGIPCRHRPELNSIRRKVSFGSKYRVYIA